MKCMNLNGEYYYVSEEDYSEWEKSGKYPATAIKINSLFPSEISFKEVKGYEDLTRILDEALQQATSGKGKERHAGNKPFDKQPIMEIARMTGLAYQTGQAMKKIQESHTLLEIKGKEAAINELRGAIIYLAAAIKTIEEN